jgi:hypothetical protein
MRRHRELFENVRARMGMYFMDESYGAAAAFVMGYDLACEGGVCTGFREWLVMRVGRGANLGWEALVLFAAFPSSNNPHAAVLASAETQRHAIDVLFSLLAEYDDVRSGTDGLRRVLVDYERWLRKRGIG